MTRLTALLLLTAAPLLAADYTVAPAGADTNPGTPDRPFRTVQHAADLLQPGDTCTLLAGTYRETVRPENSGEPGKPIVFRAAPGQAVSVSGADPLDLRWAPHQGRIFRAATDKRFIQLFVDGQMMLEARWPNSPHDDLMAMQRESAGDGTDYEQLCDPNLPPGDWNGALCLLWPGERWSNFTRRVLDYQPGKSFRFDRTFKPDKADPYHTSDPTKPRAGNPYVLFGSLAALDSAGEWYLDEQSGTLYLMPLGGDPAQHRIEVKQRSLAFDLKGLGHVELHGLRVFAAAIDMTDAHDCLVDDCRLRYPDHFREMDGYRVPPTHNVVTGRNNEWRHCGIAYSASTAILLAGQDNRLVNSIVRDGDYLGTYQGTVDLRNAVGNAVLGCTVSRGGRDLIQHHGAKRIRIEHCDLSLACMLNNDSGATYAWGTDGEGSVIAWNWVHDNQGDSTNGIYLDNFDRNFIVHHNLVWNNQSCGIVLNSDSLNNLVANNTLLGNARTFGTFTYHDRVSTQKDTRVANNLVIGRLRIDDPGTFVQGDLAPRVEHNAMAAIDAEAVPTADSAAVDAGVVIPGITDGYQGQAPDLGCYERGSERWTAGADWQDDPPLPARPRNLAFRPAPPVDAEHMLTRGLVLWLDASTAETVETDAAGTVTRWRDRSGQGHDALPEGAQRPVRRVADGLAGKPVLHGDGKGGLSVGTLRAEPGGYTVFVAMQATVAAGPSWQRVMGVWSGEGNDWVKPNWMLMRAGGATPAVMAPTVMMQAQAAGYVLDRVTIFGAGQSHGQWLAGDIAEVLLYDRRLGDDEVEAVEGYLRGKWEAK